MQLLPTPFLNSLEGLPGFNHDSFVAVHALKEQVTSLRLNADKPFETNTHRFLNSKQAIPWCSGAYYLPSRPSFVTDPLWHAGAYYVQEASSMFLKHVLTQIIPSPTNEKVLDLCAAPGGKTTLMANYFPAGLVVANETIKQRNAVLVENVTKWGGEHIVVTQNDPSHFKALPNFFDVLMIDAPCSGSGLFRKDPSAIEHWSLDSVLHCSTRQTRIIEDSIETLKERGYLIYSTCSYSFEEDEKMMDFIVSLPGLKSVDIETPAAWNIVTCESPLMHAKGFRFYPDKIKGEGFFIAVFQKQLATIAGYFADDVKLVAATKKELEVIQTYFDLPSSYDYINHQSSILALSKNFDMELRALLKNLYVKKMGLSLGEIKGKDFIPSHALAMSNWESVPFGIIDVEEETALQYLRRADLNLPGGKGWQAIVFKNIRLGWVKLLPNRLNNYYPNEWRILNY